MTNFLLPMHAVGLRQSATEVGVAFAKSRGWLQDGAFQSFVLTDLGYEEMMAAQT